MGEFRDGNQWEYTVEGVTYAHQVAWIRWGHWDQGYFLMVKNTKHMLDGSGICRHGYSNSVTAGSSWL